jgi:hypothetical protein
MTDRQRSNGVTMVRVLDEDPDLGRDVPPRTRALARTEAIAPLLVFSPGVRSFLLERPATHGHLGLLVLDGLIAQHVNFGQIGSTEFIGPGDVLRPWVVPENGDSVRVRWEILAPVRLAVMDREFANRIRPWPELSAALLDRASDRIWSQLLQSALRQAKRVDDRVLLALWHFAGRWGQVSGEGRVVRLPNLTGQVLANIVGARRQSVSTALGALATRGAIRRRGDGSWLIPDKPPQLAHLELGSRASDQAPQALQVTS